jgi:hypothetical protein
MQHLNKLRIQMNATNQPEAVAKQVIEFVLHQERIFIINDAFKPRGDTKLTFNQHTDYNHPELKALRICVTKEYNKLQTEHNGEQIKSIERGIQQQKTLDYGL